MAIKEKMNIWGGAIAPIHFRIPSVISKMTYVNEVEEREIFDGETTVRIFKFAVFFELK